MHMGSHEAQHHFRPRRESLGSGMMSCHLIPALHRQTAALHHIQLAHSCCPVQPLPWEGPGTLCLDCSHSLRMNQPGHRTEHQECREQVWGLDHHMSNVVCQDPTWEMLGDTLAFEDRVRFLCTNTYPTRCSSEGRACDHECLGRHGCPVAPEEGRRRCHERGYIIESDVRSPAAAPLHRSPAADHPAAGHTQTQDTVPILTSLNAHDDLTLCHTVSLRVATAVAVEHPGESPLAMSGLGTTACPKYLQLPGVCNPEVSIGPLPPADVQHRALCACTG